MESVLPNLTESDVDRIAMRTADLIFMRIGIHALAPLAQNPTEQTNEIPHHIPDWQTAQKVAAHFGVSEPYLQTIAEKHPELKKKKKLEPHHKRARVFLDLTGFKLYINSPDETDS